MVNAWSLLYEELNGTMDQTYPIKKNKNTDEIKLEGADEGVVNVPNDIEHSDAYYDWDRNGLTENPFIVGSGNTASANFFNFDLTDEVNNVSIDTSNLDFTIDSSQGTAYSDYADTWPHAESLNINIPDDYPSAFTALSDNDDSIAHLIDKPISSGIESDNPRKYKEDESIEALKNYISTTYGGHYTSKENNVQTLDLIESVGDAESFCRSNAIKYLSRYDKKGQAKRDILKALHYTLLLYHFSGQLNETPTRGYETF
jgi:hypothetical protein